MIELFGDPSWNMYGKSTLLQAKFVTTNGLVISLANPNNGNNNPTRENGNR